jgi:vancomycin permeability regulator SanA
MPLYQLKFLKLKNLNFQKMRLLFTVFIVLTSLFLLNAGWIIWEGLHDNLPKLGQKVDVILVYGNKVETTGLPSNRLKSRLDKAKELWQAGFSDLVVVSGGFGQEGFEESTVMKEYLVKVGLPANQIIEDKNGYNTAQTAESLFNFKKISQKSKKPEISPNCQSILSYFQKQVEPGKIRF